jgi:putative hydrolase of the HAD superfamily
MTEKKSKIKTLFLDIGGVLLTNGWDRHARDRAIKKFGLDAEEVHERHHLTFDTYEEGKLKLDDYLKRVVFYKKRDFSLEDFKKFMFSQSKPFDDMIDIIKRLKEKYDLRVVAVSNEGRELNAHRIDQFGLNEFIDAFISSCFVHFRKPDEDMFRIALDISQTPPREVVYLDDRPLFVEISQGLGIKGILHESPEKSLKALAELGLTLSDS